MALERDQVEQPRYSVVAERPGFEVRTYAPQVAARVLVLGRARTAMSSGFRPLADYIFGGNTRHDAIAMTSPVVQTPAKDASMKIAMTAPVTQTEATDGEPGHWVMFLMPSEHSLETLPTPDNDRVELIEIPAHTVAALRFSGMGDQASMERKLDELRALVEAEGLTVTGKPTFARYDPPWTLPAQRQNEVMLPVAWPIE